MPAGIIDGNFPTTWALGQVVRPENLANAMATLQAIVDGDTSIKGIKVDAGGPADISGAPATPGAVECAALQAVLATISQALTIANGVGDTDLDLTTPAAGGSYKCRMRAKLVGGATPIYARIYTNDVAQFATINAKWNDGDSKWYFDDPGGAPVASQFVFSRDGLTCNRYPGADGWAVGDWITVTVQNGATTGWLEQRYGNIVATAGNVEAAGAPAGSAGPGLLKGKRIYTTGTTITADKIVPDIGWGGAGGVPPVPVVILGDDTHGEFSVTADAGGLGPTASPTIAVTFKDGTFTGVPVVLVTNSRAVDPGTGAILTHPVSVTASATGFLIQFWHTPVPTFVYYFNWIAIGR